MKFKWDYYCTLCVHVGISLETICHYANIFYFKMDRNIVTKTLAEQVADLEDPTPRGSSWSINLLVGANICLDIDPEAFGDAFDHIGGSDENGSDAGEAGDAREHYQSVE